MVECSPIGAVEGTPEGVSPNANKTWFGWLPVATSSGLLGPNSIMVVYMDPLGTQRAGKKNSRLH